MKKGDTVNTVNRQPEPPLRPRRQWETWFKRQGNPGWVTHAEWRRKAGIIRMDRHGMSLGRLDERA